MAEGGEGEEEIQFLRTVSPAHSPFLGNLYLLEDERSHENSEEDKPYYYLTEEK